MFPTKLAIIRRTGGRCGTRLPAMSNRPTVPANRRGLVAALIVAGILLFAGIEWMRSMGHTPEIVSRWVDQVYTPPSYSSEPYSNLSRVDQETLRWQDEGALVGQAIVISGDVIQMGDRAWRLWGTREIAGQWQCAASTALIPCQATSRATLENMVEGGLVACFDKGYDQWNYPVARCMRGQNDLGSWMIRAGAGLPEPADIGDNKLEPYYMNRAEAEGHRRGAWASQP